MTKLLALAVILTTIGCGAGYGSSPSSPSSTVSADVTIQIQGDRGNQSFAPSPTTVRVGQTVAWKNADSIAHDTTQDASRFGTGTLNAGTTSNAITMSTAGTFTYHCAIHPGMTGTITVQ